MSGRGGGGGRGGGRRSDSRRDQSSQSSGGSYNRGGGGGGRGGRGGGGRGGRGYGDAAAGGSRPGPDPYATGNFPPSASASTSAASLSHEFDKSLTLQSSSSAPVRRPASHSVQQPIQTTAPPPPPPTQAQPSTPVPSQPQPQASASEQAIAVEVPPSTSKAITFPRRPGYGTVGRKCTVRANHFQVELARREFHHYDVSYCFTLFRFCFDVVSSIFYYFHHFCLCLLFSLVCSVEALPFSIVANRFLFFLMPFFNFIFYDYDNLFVSFLLGHILSICSYLS